MVTEMSTKPLTNDKPITWRDWHRVWVLPVNTREWQMVAGFSSRQDAREFAERGVSTSGGRILRVEIRTPNEQVGECTFDASWSK